MPSDTTPTSPDLLRQQALDNAALGKELRRQGNSRSTALNRMLPADIENPIENETVVDPTDDQLTWYANGAWHKGGAGGVGPWQTPTLINSYGAPASPKIAPRYRYVGTGPSDSLELDGDVDVTDAFSGTAAFILDEDYWRDHDIDYASVRDEDGIKTFASVYIDSTNGEVRLYW